MYQITMLTAMEYIDEAANENRLYHYNGGQAYIQNANDPNQLMIIDHTWGSLHQDSEIQATCEVLPGTQYFETYKGYNKEYSARMREHGSMVAWYKENYPIKEIA